MNQLQRFRSPVVVAVTGTESDPTAVRLAAAEATLRDRELHLLAGYRAPVADADAAEPSAALGSARGAMIAALGVVRATHPDLVVDCRVVPGDPAELLIGRSGGADIVVVPATADGLLGDRVAAHARCPVLVARRNAVPGGDVLVALDGAPPADPLLEFGFTVATMRGVPLRPVLVWAALPGTALGTIDPFAYDVAAAHAEADRLLAEELAGWSDKYPDIAVHRREIRAPEVATALVEASTTAGLLVVGARSRPARSGLALGPVTRRLIRKAHCPVAVITLTEPQPMEGDTR